MMKKTGTGIPIFYRNNTGLTISPVSEADT